MDAIVKGGKMQFPLKTMNLVVIIFFIIVDMTLLLVYNKSVSITTNHINHC